MGRPPSNGGPSFRFNPVEVGEMEAILQAHNYTVPSREILEALAQRFSTSADRAGKVEVSGKQVWNWFQNRRYALRAKAARTSVPGQVNMPSVPRDDQSVVRNVPQAPQPPQPQVSQPPPAPQNMVRSMPQVPQPLPTPSAQNASRNVSDNSLMEFEAKSARDGAWYDVASFLSHRSLESGDPEAMVRFAGFGPEEDEWVNIRRHIRQRSLPCESSECVAVLPGDLILCFQEGKEQALYFDAHVLDAQRRRHDVRGCRCRFLVRYDHDQSEEIVPLRKICRRPETDHRLQQLHAMPINVNPQKIFIEAQAGNILRFDAADSTIQKQQPKQEQRVNLTTSATPTTIPPAGESKLVPSKAVDAGNATAVANTDSSNTATVNESKLVPSKLADARNATPVANIDSSSTATVNESKLVPSKVVDAGNATSVANTDSSSTATVNESKLVPSKVFDAGNATSVANTDSSSTATVDESKLVPSKAADAANATGVANADSSDTAAVNESKLVPSKAADAGNITAIANADSSITAAVDESKLLPSKAADAGNATAVSNTDSSNTAAVNESNLVPSKAVDAGNATAVANTDSSDTAAVNESNLVPSKAADAENATAVASTDSSNTAAVNESNIVPSKAADVENATAVANTDSSNTAALNTAATGVSHPTLPQG